MKYEVIFESITGNTRMLAEAIRRMLGEADCVCFGTPAEKASGKSGDDAKEAVFRFIGFWTDKGTCSEAAASYMESLEGQDVFLFGTAGFGGSDAYFSQILSRVSAHLGEGCRIAGTYMCQGKMPESVRKRYAAMLEENPQDAKVKAMLDNYDRALAHPDESDIEGLQRAAAEAWDKAAAQK